MPSLHVVALISGGKDSLFSILHCIENGHRVVALANLHPPQSDTHDMDSFMYQTVGHNVIEQISRALELPLYREAIQGSAIDTSRTYDKAAASQGVDEVESMHALLLRIKRSHPEIDAVCTGAILSDYQRTRVESVAVRLGLTPLSYLWQYPFLPPYSDASLLRDMNAVGQDSRIIKVASGALNETLLWQNVADLGTIGKLVKSAERFGTTGDGSIIGEGGEYETLTVDGPAPLWKHRIVVDEENRDVVAGDAGTATIEIKKFTTEPKQLSSTAGYTAVRRPPLLDAVFEDLQARLLESDTPTIEDYLGLDAQRAISLPMFMGASSALGTLSNVSAPGNTASEQAKRILIEAFTNRSVDPQNVLHTVILLRNMEDFQSVNTVYGSFFSYPNPPSRVTVSCGQKLPEDQLVVMSFIVIPRAQATRRTGLHVQSRSYWAPANIGPYSQAIAVSTGPTSFVHVAGQIPLVPASMDLVADSAHSPRQAAVSQSVLSLQHLWRIGTVMNVNMWLGAVAFLGRSANGTSPENCVEAAARAWAEAHTDKPGSTEDDTEEEEVDIWDRRNIHTTSASRTTTASTYRSTIQRTCFPPCFAAEVETLPRNAAVEWASNGWTAAGSVFHVEADRGNPGHQRIFSRSGPSQSLLAGWLALPSLVDAVTVLKGIELPEHALYTVYTTTSLPAPVCEQLRPQIIPCYRLWDANGKQLQAVVAYVNADLVQQ